MAIRTILVEDNKTIRDAMIPSMNEIAGIEVIGIAETADEGLAALQAHKDTWQLAVIDLFLRAGTGLTVVKAAKDRNPGQHVLVLSNYATPDMRARCLEDGANAVFDKSTELDAFFEYCIDHFPPD